MVFLVSTKLKHMKSTLLFFTFFLSLICNAQNCFEKHKIKSKVLKENRSIWIGLPKNYNKDSSYSVVYVLDAEDRFDITYSITKELFENQNTIPELIVVGIPNIDKLQRLFDLTFTNSKVNVTGRQDTIGYFSSSFTGNGLPFLNFLEKEVVPYVKTHFSTNDFNTLIGHSISGYFCAYILPIQKSFSAFQIYDASIWFNDGDAITHIKNELDSNKKCNIFISKGITFDGPDGYIDHHLSMIDSLGTILIDYPNLNIATATYKKDHNAMFLYSLMDGLNTLYKKQEKNKHNTK